METERILKKIIRSIWRKIDGYHHRPGWSKDPGNLLYRQACGLLDAQVIVERELAHLKRKKKICK